MRKFGFDQKFLIFLIYNITYDLKGIPRNGTFDVLMQ